MPLLGHRNWILIVDSAYPLQSAPGIETVETNASQLEVLRHVLGAIDRSIHVRPVISMDAELPFSPKTTRPASPPTALKSTICCAATRSSPCP
jgi:hypothetical protein